MKNYGNYFDVGPLRMSGSQSFYGRYRGVSVETKEFPTLNALNPEKQWIGRCAYIRLSSVMFDAETWKKVSKQKWLEEHLPCPGGITFFEASTRRAPRTGKRFAAIKFGWDYSHSWNYERGEVPPQIPVQDLMTCVDQLTTILPDMLVWSQMDGTYVPVATVGTLEHEYNTCAPTDPTKRFPEPAKLLYHPPKDF